MAGYRFPGQKGNPACEAHFPKPDRKCPKCAINLAIRRSTTQDRKRHYRPCGTYATPDGREYRCKLPRGHDGIHRGITISR